MKWLIPLLVILFVLGKLAEAMRLARGSAYEDIKLLQAAIQDVQNRARKLQPEQALAVADMLAPAVQVLEACQRQIDKSTPEMRKAMRLLLKPAMHKVAAARAFVDLHSVDSGDEED